MNTHIHIEDRLFQDIGLPCRVEKFRENPPRDVEKSVDEKKITRPKYNSLTLPRVTVIMMTMIMMFIIPHRPYYVHRYSLLLPTQ